MAIIISDDRWLLPDGRVVRANDKFILNEMQYLNGIAGLSAEQITERGIVKMPNVPHGRFGEFSQDEARPGHWVIDLTRIRALVVDEIKSSARNVILKRFPEWKQANMTARGTELTFTLASGGTLSEAEQAEVAELQAAWGWIKTIRTHSNKLEAEVNGVEFDGLVEWQQHDWPA